MLIPDGVSADTVGEMTESPVPGRGRPERSRSQQLIATLSGAALALIAVMLWGGIATEIPEALVPNPFRPDYPSSWGESLSGVLAAAIVAAVGGLAAAAAVGLLTGHLNRRGVIGAALGSAIVVCAGAAVMIAAQRDEARVAPACNDYAFQRSDWRDADQATRQEVALWIVECDAFHGRSEVQLLRAFGQPVQRKENSLVLVYPDVQLRLDPATREVVGSGIVR